MGRFSFSSPGRRGRDDPWFRLGTIDVNTTILVIALAVISMFIWAVDARALISLALLPDDVLSGEVWRLVTWPLYNEPSLWVVLTLLVFYWFGRELERLLGRTRFLWYLGLIALVPGVVATGLGVGAAGMRWVSMACFLAFAVLYPQARSWFNIPLWVIAVVFIGIDVLQLLGLRDGDGLVFLAVVCLTSLLALRLFGLGEDITWLPKLQRPPRRKRRRLRAVPDPAPQPKRWTPKPGEGLHQAELDMLLDKIASEGIGSLTAEERRRLDEASRRLRDERG